MKRLALVIGHNQGFSGAINEATGISEFEYNCALAFLIKNEINMLGLDLHVRTVFRNSYDTLPEQINRQRPDFVISLHANAYNGAASGSEVLYYHNSAKGKRMAEYLQKTIVNVLGLPDRGVNPKAPKERGSYLLSNTVAPCVILEPFFIDNNNNLKIARKKITYLSTALAVCIDTISRTYF